MVFAEATQYPPWRHCLLCRGCAMVFMGGGKKSGYLRYFLWEEHFVRYLTPHFSRTKGWYYFFLVLGIGFLPWSFFIPVTAKNLWNRTFTGANLFLTLWVILPFAFF